MKMVQRLREHITAALNAAYPGLPVYVTGEKPQVAYFRLELLSAVYDRQREGRYMAVYKMGIRYEQGGQLDSEELADGLCEALAVQSHDEPAFRVMRQAWEAGKDGSGPVFTVDYMLYLQKQEQGQTDTVLMGQLSEGAFVK
ncbi:hypothetical protein R70723_29300 [Paenibacillus sp. FSL R7-0273]|uniref:phage tail terminator family protein n=1 Tax=Paenibacillus sp. FSL R7-0273 TaxID=1536772 RepID=UPI0004F7A4E6|nr:hypothetical protein [Paenibacillus sp. FSL R7-0273]AIQ49525.1 hypothetical protein R70723_29300 [Paenibacillus sp. FSL R7-0273]OMF89723.1 hypothetical protein BK144_19400 [Paenibacillus sp. FSL R7-0273]